MRLLPMYQRLCWKEFRQGWLMLALGLLLPLLAANLQQLKLLEWTMPSIALFMLLLGVCVWGAMLGAGARARQSYAGVHFPQHPALASCVTFWWQGSAAALIGILIGAVQGNSGHLFDVVDFSLLGMLYFASAFAVSFIMASVFSPWSGIVTSIIWVLGNSTTLSALTEGNFRNDLEKPMQVMAGVIVMSLIALLILSFTTRVDAKWPRVLACLLLGAVLLIQPICWLGDDIFHNSSVNYPSPLSSDDGSLVVKYDPQTLHYRSVDLQIIDYRRQKTLTKHFEQDIQPLWLAGRSTVMLAQQRKQEHHLTLLRWALDTNTVEPFAAFPTGSVGFSQFASLSPDGQYAVMLIQSSMGGSDSYDIWKIDMQTRKLTLLKPAAACASLIRWQGHDALIDCGLSVSMTTGQVKPRPLPAPWEGKE